jgi:hypothetical protein
LAVLLDLNEEKKVSGQPIPLVTKKRFINTCLDAAFL